MLSVSSVIVHEIHRIPVAGGGMSSPADRQNKHSARHRRVQYIYSPVSRHHSDPKVHRVQVMRDMESINLLLERSLTTCEMSGQR